MSQLVTIATFSVPARAQVLKTRLEAENISVFLKNETITQIAAFHTLSNGGIQLQVQTQDFESALAIAKNLGFTKDYIPNSTDKLIAFAAKYGEKIKWFANKPPLERLLITIGLILGFITVAVLVLSGIYT